MRRRLRNVVLRMVLRALCAVGHIRSRVVTRRVRHVMRRLILWTALLGTLRNLLRSHLLLILVRAGHRPCVGRYVRISWPVDGRQTGTHRLGTVQRPRLGSRHHRWPTLIY